MCNSLSSGGRDLIEGINLTLQSMEHASAVATRTRSEAQRALWRYVEAGAELTETKFKHAKRLAELEDESNDADALARHAAQKLAWEGRHVLDFGK